MEKMSRHPIPLNPGFVPPATHGVLKSLLEKPLKLPPRHEGEVRPENAAQSAAFTSALSPSGVSASHAVLCVNGPC